MSKISIKTKIFTFLRRNYIYLIMLALVGARVMLGHALGGWYGMSEIYDDVAMMQGLSLTRLIAPTNLALIKDLSFSLFLGFTAITNLPYTVVLSLFWALAALIAWLLARKLTDKKWVQLLVFAYVLFLPIAFTSWGGLRIYRNAIIAPSIIITFSLGLMVLVDLVKQEKLRKSVWTAIFAGLSFAFTYFLKEDGIWLAACMLVLLIICLIVIIYRFFKVKKRGKHQIKPAFAWAVICLIPFLVLFVWSNVYKGFNYAFFDVYETNTRTRGELGRFVENVYKIDSPNRTSVVWAPYDAIQAAFAASPTLGAHPELLEEIMTTGWNAGGIIENPIKRDFLGWVMRSELVDTGLWTTEKEVDDFFKQVNAELDAAFADGTLQQPTDRFQLLASVGGYTWEEVASSNLFVQVTASLADSFWFVNYDIGFSDEDVSYGTKDLEWDYTKVNKVLHMEGDVNIVEKEGRDVAKKSVMVIWWIYRVANTIIIIMMIVLTIYHLVMMVKNRHRQYLSRNRVSLSCTLASIAFFGIAIVYSFATAWFFILPAEGVSQPMLFVFYRVGVPGIMALSSISAMVGFATVNRSKNQRASKAK